MVDERLDRTMSMEGWATTHTSNGHEHDTNVHGLEDHEHEGTGNDPCELGLHGHEHETLGHSMTDH